jgi:TctA family transporter
MSDWALFIFLLLATIYIGWLFWKRRNLKGAMTVWGLLLAHICGFIGFIPDDKTPIWRPFLSIIIGMVGAVLLGRLYKKGSMGK